MHILLVSVHVKPGEIEAFRRATLENAAASRLEAGIARFDVIQQVDEPARFVLFEAYRNQEAHAAHRQAPHYLRWVDAVAPMMAEPRTRSVYSNVDPQDAQW
jgi:autoinducer 2-degrading protein